MALFLEEDMVGADANMIAFPHLVLCMGMVVVMGDGTLIGAHFTQPTTEKAILYLVSRHVELNASGMDQLYCMADLDQHFKQGGMDILGKAKGIGFKGQGYVADFGVLQPTNGTYAQLTTKGAGNKASVRCKLNQEVKYTNTASLTSGPAVKIVKLGVVTGNKMKDDHATKIASVALKGNFNTPFMKPITI